MVFATKVAPGFAVATTATAMFKMLLLRASFSRHFSGIRGRSSLITIGEKILHLLDRSAEHSLQAALS
jgi:hypothetical protein